MSFRKVLAVVLAGSALSSWAFAQSALPQAPSTPAVSPPAPAPAPAAEALSLPTVPARSGQDILENSCTGCHDLGVLTATQHTPEDWPVVLKRMVGHGLNISPTDLTTVQAYLTETYSSPDAH